MGKRRRKGAARVEVEAPAPPPAPPAPTAAPRRWWPAAVAAGAALCALVYSQRDDGKDWSKGGQRGAWSAEERDQAANVCRSHAAAYRVSSCRVSAFCRCAVSNYESRGPFREFRDSLAPAVAAYVRPGASGYFCTGVAASACGEQE